LGATVYKIDEVMPSLSPSELSSSIFIFEKFEGTLFEQFRKKLGTKMYSPAIILQALKLPKPVLELPSSKSGYPIYCQLLNNCRVTVTGIGCYDELV